MFLRQEEPRQPAIGWAAESDERLVVRTRADSPELKRAAQAIEQAAWAELGFLNYTRSHYDHYAALLEAFPDFQLVLVNEETGYPVAAGNCVPIKCADPDGLPPEGWDWAVHHAAMRRGEGADTLCALAISVPPLNRRLGYARRMIEAFNALAKAKGLERVVAPVRPSAKTKHPFVPIDDYVDWTDDEGRAFDPWLRSHIACGARIVRVCKRSMVVEEPLPFWETWASRRFEESGEYQMTGALAPVSIDVARGVGRYEEPNVWVAYN